MYFYDKKLAYLCAVLLLCYALLYHCLASSKDVSTTPVYVRFNTYQQKAVGTIRIFSDDLIEGVELFAVKMTLPSRGLYKRFLYYRHPKHALVYIRDCKYQMLYNFGIKLYCIVVKLYRHQHWRSTATC